MNEEKYFDFKQLGGQNSLEYGAKKLKKQIIQVQKQNALELGKLLEARYRFVIEPPRKLSKFRRNYYAS